MHIISTYPCPDDILPGAELRQVPLAFSKMARASTDNGAQSKTSRPLLKTTLAHLRSGPLSGMALSAHLWITPIELRRHVGKVEGLITRLSPDLVNAMRIPFEGIMAAKATPAGTPLLISVWGNDFTLCAANNLLVARQTRQALKRADALHTDCARDLKLAIQDWGFSSEKPAAVLPGAGGIQTSLFYPGEPDAKLREQLNIHTDAPVIINPRGMRGYVRNDVFFQAIPLVLRDYPRAIFCACAMEGNQMAESWVKRLAIQDNVRLLPPVSRERMADLFRLARVAVSPSLHDGTPNTLLEAMASGCFPVAGDIESVREWITDEANGLLCDPANHDSLARAIIRALDDEPMRNDARQYNLNLIAERAEYNKSMRQAEEFCIEVVRRKQQAMKV